MSVGRMIRKDILIFGLIYFLIFPVRGSISIVYNLRVAETSKRIEVKSTLASPSLGTFTGFGTFREKYNGIKHACGGGLFTLVYAPESFFLRIDAAVGRVSSNDHGVHFSRTQTDDLLFSGGYSPRISNKIRLTFSGLLGLPTHKDTSIAHIQLGYGHYGLGVQMDGSFIFSSNSNHTLRCAARFIHFFPRTVLIKVEGGHQQFKYGIGDLADLFIAFHGKRAEHSFETGYNPSFFFNARICPHFDSTVEKTNYIRNSFYGIYKYRFLINKITHMIAAALSYGFEPTPKVFGNKRIITLWASWSINF